MVGYLFKPIEKRQSIYSHTQAKKQQQWERKVRVLLHLWNIVWFMFTLPPKYGNQQYILYVIDKTRSKIQSKSNWSNRVLRYSTVFFFHHNMWMPIDIAATHTPLLNIWEEIFFFPFLWIVSNSCAEKINTYPIEFCTLSGKLKNNLLIGYMYRMHTMVIAISSNEWYVAISMISCLNRQTQAKAANR